LSLALKHLNLRAKGIQEKPIAVDNHRAACEFLVHIFEARVMYQHPSYLLLIQEQDIPALAQELRHMHNITREPMPTVIVVW